MFFEGIQDLYQELKDEAAAVYSDAQSELQGWGITERRSVPRAFRRKPPKVRRVEKKYHFFSEEVHFIAVAFYAQAHETIQRLHETEIRPFRDAIAAEFEVLTDTASQSEDLAAARKFAEDAAEKVKSSFTKRTRRPGSLVLSAITFQSVGRALKQARELIFSEDNRGSQLDEIQGPAEGSARSQIAQAEKAVNRYLKVAASSVVVATAGTLFFAPLKLVSGGMILYAAYPVFKGACLDIVQKRKVTIRLLDSVSFLGLIAGGYFLICSLTSTIFHASTKMMLKTEDRSRQLLANMFGQQPQTVWVIEDGREIEIPFEQLAVGAILVIQAGQMIPIDGSVAAGTAAVDQHVLTGEAQPAEKGKGDRVFAATVVLAGRIEVRVEQTGAETAAAQIRDMLANTTDFRTAIQVRWKDVADKTVLPTLGLAGLALLALGPVSALAVVNSNYVAVMKVASPLGMLNFLQRASLAGILIKDGRALEAASGIDTIVFDKTGTLTETQPHVGEIYTWNGAGPDELLTYAAAVESKQSHPIANAIVEAAEQRNLPRPDLEDARYEMGYGIQARVDGRLVRVGSARYMSMEGIPLPVDFEESWQGIQARGASVVFVALGDKLSGAIELRPTLRPEARQVVADLHQRGLRIYIISGDHAAPTQALAAELGIDDYFAEVLPQDKSRQVERLQREGRKVCFVGDGINDAIALKTADLSVSLRGASSLATNTAQIILMDESLKQLTQLFEVAGEYHANLKTLMTTTFGPGFASLAAVFLLGAGNGTALALFNLSMLAGLVNGIWPALQQASEITAKPVLQIEAAEQKPDISVST